MDELNMDELIAEINPGPRSTGIYANRRYARNPNLCPLCSAPKSECHRTEDLTITTGSGGQEGASNE